VGCAPCFGRGDSEYTAAAAAFRLAVDFDAIETLMHEKYIVLLLEKAALSYSLLALALGCSSRDAITSITVVNEGKHETKTWSGSDAVIIDAFLEPYRKVYAAAARSFASAAKEASLTERLRTDKAPVFVPPADDGAAAPAANQARSAAAAAPLVDGHGLCPCSATERCVWDTVGCPGLGCGAMGVANCRFCGFGDFFAC